MPETIQAVLEKLEGRSDRLEQFRDLLGDTTLREAYHDHVEEVARRQSGHYSAAMNSRAAFYAELVRREGLRLKGPEALDAVDEILRQYPQILNAIDVALSRNDAEQLAVFVEHISHPLTVKSRFKEGEALFARLLRKAEELDNRALEVSARLRYGQFLYHLSRFDEASTMLAKAAVDAEQEGDDDGLARALNFQGHIASDQGNLTAALAQYKQSLELYRRLCYRNGICAALGNLGNLARMQFRYADARELLLESLEIAREEGDDWLTVKALGNLATVAVAEGKLAEAKLGFEQAFLVGEKLGDWAGMARSLGNLANVHVAQDNLTEAERCYRRAIDVYEFLGSRQFVGLNSCNLAYLLVDTGKPHEALKLFSLALTIARQLEDQEGATAALHGQATAAYRAGDYHEALGPLGECIAISTEIGQFDFLGNHYLLQSLIYYALGDYDRADSCADLAAQTYCGIDNRMRLADSLCNKARISLKAGCVRDAVGWLLKALAKRGPVEVKHPVSILHTAGRIFSASRKQTDGAVMFYALQHHAKQVGIVLPMCYQTELEEGINDLASLAPEVRAEAKARGEALSPEELADYALKALEELKAELDIEELGRPDGAAQPKSANGSNASTG